MIKREYVPPLVRCKNCFGGGRIERIKNVEAQPIPVCTPELSGTEGATLEKENVPCERCDGEGRHRAKMPGHIRLFQDGREIGTVPSVFPELHGPSVFVQIRQGDYTPAVHDDEVILIASPTLGPGDISAINGFQPTKEMSPYYKRDKDFEAFDRVAAEMLRKK